VVLLRTAVRMFLRSANNYTARHLSVILKSLFFTPIKKYALNQNILSGVRVLMFFLSNLIILIRSGI
jgi:hypothetical protein